MAATRAAAPLQRALNSGHAWVLLCALASCTAPEAERQAPPQPAEADPLTDPTAGAAPWTVVVEAEEFWGGAFVLCPGPDCDDDRSEAAHGGGHLLGVYAARARGGDPSAWAEVLLPTGGEVHAWALSVRTSQRRRWTLSVAGGPAARVGDGRVGVWQRAGTLDLTPGGPRPVELLIEDAGSDTLRAYPDAILLTTDPAYDPEADGTQEPSWRPPGSDATCAESGGVCMTGFSGCLRQRVRMRNHGCDGFGAWCCARDERCDDGTPRTCDARAPTSCAVGELLAVKDGCWACVHEVTCLPWGVDACTADADCGPTEICEVCAASPCPQCAGCTSACVRHGCDTAAGVSCMQGRPECDAGQVSVIRQGCWTCVDSESCDALRGEGPR